MTKSLKASLRKSLAGVVMMTTIFSLSGIAAVIPVAQAATIVDGDVIRNPGAAGDAQFDVYIVKIVGADKYKRLVLNPQVFASYGHLKWENVKTVTSAEMNEYKTSAMVRVETDPKVYALAPNGDTGSKSWLNVGADVYTTAGGTWNQVYTINAVDAANYAAATDLTTSEQVVTFLTTGVLPGGVVTPTPTPTPVVGGTVGVSLAANTAASATLTKGSVGNDVLSFVVTAASDADAVLNSIKFKRTGVGLSTDYSNVYVYDGATRLKNGKSIASDTNTVEFTSIGLTVAKGTSKTLTVKADVYASAGTGDVNSMTIQAASDIMFASGTTSGSFPIVGNGMSIGSQSVGTSVVANGTSVSKPTLGQSGAKVATIKVTAGVNDISIKSLTLVQNGSVTNTNITNLSLKNASDSTVLGTAATMTGDKAVITLSTPLAISKNQNKTMELYADLAGGKTTDTIRFYLEETGDIVIVDQQYTQNSAITNSFGSTAAYCVGAASNTCPTAGSFQGGTITLVDNGPAAKTIAKNTTNVDLFKFNITSTRNVTVKDYEVTLEQTTWDSATAIGLGGGSGEVTSGSISAAGALTALRTDVNDAANLAAGDIIKITDDSTTPDNYYYVRMTTVGANTATADSAGTVVASNINGVWSYGATTTAATLAAADSWVEIYDTHLRSYVKNVKLVDVDSGNTLASTATSEPFIAFTDDFDIAAGQTRHLAIRADLDSSLVAANIFKAGVDFTVASTIKDNDANQYVATADVVAGNIVGKNMTVGAASLTVARASTPVSATKVKGAANVEALGISLTAGSSSKDKITSLVVRLLADTDATFVLGYGDTDASSVVSTVSLYDGATKISGPKSLSALVGTVSTDGYRPVTFDGLSYEIPAGTTQKLTVKVDLKNTISSTTYLVATVDPSADITALDADGNTLTISDTADGWVNENDTDTGVQDTTPAVVITVATSGTLSAAVEGSPASAIAVAGATNVVMAKYKFNALNEAFTVNKLDVASDTDGTPDFTDDPTADIGNDNDIVRVGVRSGGVTTWSNLSGGKAGFSDLNIAVPINGSVYVEILADLNTIADGATSGETPRLGISTYTTTNTFEAVGVGSSETKAIANVTFTAEANVKAMTLRKTAPTVAKVSGLTTILINGTNTLYGFTVAADAGAAVSMKRIALTTSFSDDLDVNGLKFYRGSTDITDDVSIRNMIGQNLKTGGSNLVTNTGTATSDIVYVTWDKASTDEEVISAGASNTYYVKATVASAGTGESISMYIADDTTAEANAVGVAALRTTTTSTNPETATASVNNTRMVWRFGQALTAGGTTANDDYVYLDIDGSGSYAAATDYKVLIANDNATDLYAGSVDAANEIVVGDLRYTTSDIDANAGTTTGENGLYFDINGNGAFNATADIGLAITDATGAAVTNNAVVTHKFKYDGTVELYIDPNNGGTYDAAADHKLIAANVTPPSTAPATDAEAYTASMNLVWSDNSDTSHTTSTTDWTNGYLVNDLATTTQTLSY